MAKGVNISGVQEVLKTFNNLKGAVADKVDGLLTGYVTDVAAEAKQLAPKDMGTMAGNIIPRTQEYLKKSVVVHSPYAAWREFGTGKLAAAYVATIPPEWQEVARQFKGSTGGKFDDFVKALEGWVKRKGIGAKSMNIKTRKANYGKNAQNQIKSIAYAIAVSITQNGSQAQPYLLPAVQHNLPKLINLLRHMKINSAYVERPYKTAPQKIVTI